MVPEHGSYFALRQPNENKVLINDQVLYGSFQIYADTVTQGCSVTEVHKLNSMSDSQMDIRLTRSFNRRSRLGEFTKNLSFSRKAYRLEWTFV